MRKSASLIVLFLLSFSFTVFAQQASNQYDKAASAYQSGNFVEAEKLWAALAEQGDPNAQYALGIMHLKKEAQRSDDATAFRYLVEAAKKQHVASMFNLGVAYWEGRGVARQPEKALNWWEVAAQRDDAGAQYNLGLAYYIGEGRAQSTPKAIYWVQQAAKNGHPQAQSLLLTMQKESKEAVQDKQTARAGKPAASRASSSQPEPNSRIRLSKISTPLRAAPNLKATQVSILKSGTSVRAIQTQDDWIQVVVARSYPVWVYETFLRDLGNGSAEIKGNKVNIRPAASTDNRTSPPLGQLNNGARVSIVSRQSPWVQILPSQPFPAWVKSEDMQ